MTTRTDIHRPSAIDPADYDFVGVEYSKIESLDDLYSLAFYRDQIRAHETRTGAKFSRHEHGGNCHVCGAHCIYTARFYHRETNTYIRTGFDCAEKMHAGDENVFRDFRTAVRSAIECKAGKAKARAVLAEAGLEKVWDVFQLYERSCYPNYDAAALQSLVEIGAIHFYGADRETQYGNSDELRILMDLVAKLIRYGSLSEKQLAFAEKLLDKMLRRPEIEAQKRAEHEAAADCPTGKVTVLGEVLTVKEQESMYGLQIKTLVRDDRGFKVWSTLPAAIRSAKRGDRVTFTATLEPSRDDKKFGFAKRPTKAEFVTVEEEMPVA